MPKNRSTSLWIAEESPPIVMWTSTISAPTTMETQSGQPSSACMALGQP
ncbi:hypothetical protein ACN27G_23695 [Plantactinospora sp. WMMB334]